MARHEGQLLLPSNPTNRARATLCPQRIYDALEFFEIEADVEIRWTVGTRRRGAHRFYRERNEHLVTLSIHLTPEALSRTLWHELTHAWQMEQVEDYAMQYRNENRENGYRGNRFEREARANALAYADDAPLVRERGAA